MHKLVYILPEASTRTHMKYNVEFVKSLADRGVDIFLILEKGSMEDFETDWGFVPEKYFGKNVKTYFIENSNSLFRTIKTFYILTKTSLLGYKKYYIHYSFISSILSSISNPSRETYYWNCGIPWQYKRPFWQELYETFNYKVISHLVTGTQGLGEQYANYYKFNKGKNIIIPNWIDLEQINQKVKNVSKTKIRKELGFLETDIILFFNQRLSERKGAHYILPILRSTNENVKIIITNDGPYKEKLLLEIKSNNSQDRVMVLGRVANDRVIELMCTSDIYILPSEEEGMSHSLMEAFATATPVVAFDVGGTKEMFPENYRDYCVPTKDLEKLAKKLNYLISDKKERNNFGEAAKKYTTKYNKPKVLDLFINAILNK